MTVDRWILSTTLALLALGLLMVASASMVISDQLYHFPLYFFLRQSLYLVIGVLLGAVVFYMPIHFWKRYSVYLLLLGFLLLIIVLIPGLGRTVNGSRRWLNLGLITLQVSELIKFFMILYLARYIERFNQTLQENGWDFLKPFALLILVDLLLLCEPDFGAAVIITVCTLLMLYLAGAKLLPFFLLLLAVVAALALLAVTSPYRLARLTSFLNPWDTPFGSGYQLTQSLMALGRGGIFGVGLGNSVQKLFYLPEAHTDFLFAVIVEELGLLGALLFIALFVLLIARIFRVGTRAYYHGDIYASFVAYGVGIWLGLQAAINIGVNMGLLPTKGITLPFVSYGGSSMLVNCVVIGVVLRVAREHVAKEEGGRRARVSFRGVA